MSSSAVQYSSKQDQEQGSVIKVIAAAPFRKIFCEFWDNFIDSSLHRLTEIILQ